MPNLNEMIENDVQILERDSAKCPPGVLAQVLRTVCWIDERNANNRKYRKPVWEKVFDDPAFKRKMENRQILGEHEHPESSALKLDKDRTSHIVSKMYFGEAVMREGKMRIPVKAVFDILPTDAGKFVWILHEAGVRVGASTRADGSLIEQIDEDGSKYMDVNEKDYRFTTIDNTGDPSCSNTEPESIISAVRMHYENKSINKNVAIALLESVKTEAAKALEKIIKEDTTAEAVVKEELTTSSDTSGQPADLKASKQDFEKSKRRGEETDSNSQDLHPEAVPTQEAKIDEATGDKVRQFLQDNWEMFLTDQELEANGSPASKKIDAVRNVAKVFNMAPDMAAQYVDELQPASVAPMPSYTATATHETVDATKDLQVQLTSVRENYANDVLRLSVEIAGLGDKAAKLTENYTNDTLTFVNESASLKGKIAGLEKDAKFNVSTASEAIALSEKNVATIKKLTEDHKKLLGEVNGKISKLVKELAAKESSIKDAEGQLKHLKEASAKEVKDLKEMHQKEKIHQYVDYRLNSMKLRLHENVLTLLRQSKSTTEVDTLIRETQDALREGLTHSVGRISEVIIEKPVDRNQVDITNKVAIALKHFTGL